MLLPKLRYITDFTLRRDIMLPVYNMKIDQQHITNANKYVPHKDIKNIFNMERENGPLKSSIK
jgi:hypothetical protein